MRIKDPLSEGEEPFNLVPLTDMVFNLLIFFMCATTFAEVEKDLAVQLPKTSSSFTTMSGPPKDLIINIKRDGSAVVSGKTYNLQELAQIVTSAVKRNASQSIIIRADVRGLVQGFDDVTSVCQRAGVREGKIAYVTEGGKAVPGK